MTEKIPNLICPGAMKSGTSSLYKILVQHKDIIGCGMKELQFFNDYYYKGMDWYRNLFKDVDEGRYYIDFTPGYMVREEYIKRILESLGKDVKFIVMLRNPVDRMYSHYMMNRSLGIEASVDATDVFERDLREYWEGKKNSNYYRFSLYSQQIQWIYDRFPAENIHIVKLSDLSSDSMDTIKEILRFLQLEEDPAVDYNIWTNKTKMFSASGTARFIRKIIKITPKRLWTVFPLKTRKAIKNFLNTKLHNRKKTISYSKDLDFCREFMDNFKEDIDKLEKLTGIDFSEWFGDFNSYNDE